MTVNDLDTTFLEGLTKNDNHSLKESVLFENHVKEGAFKILVPSYLHCNDKQFW